MANKLTIDQINERLDELHRDLTRTVTLIDKYRKLRRDIRRGKIKQPAPKGIKVMFADRPLPTLKRADAIDYFNDDTVI